MFGESNDARWPPAPDVRAGYRIAMIGGSTVAQVSPGAAALPSLLEAELKARRKNVSVYNLGVVSQASGQELAQLVFDVVDAKPDLVVLYDGGNDIMDPLYLDPRPGYPMDFLVAENNPLSAPAAAYPSFALLAFGSAWARSHYSSYFLDKLLHFPRLRREAGVDTDAWREKIAASYVGNVVKAAKIARAFGVDLVVVFQPLVFFKEPLGPEEAKMRDADWSAHARDVRRRILARVEKLGPSDRPTFIDFSRVFDGTDGDVFRDYIHLRPEYQVPLARKLALALSAARPLKR